MKIISLNVNGIRSAANKGLFEWLEYQNADFVCLQETKAQVFQLSQTNNSQYFPKNYHVTYCDALKKGYSGVAIYAKLKPLSITNKLDFSTCDDEGRYLRYDYEEFSIISAYFPSGTSGEERQIIKYDFLDKFAEHLQILKQNNKSIILCGDVNIAHQKRDLKNWRGNQKHTGFLPQERAWLDYIFDEMGFVDAFRVKNQTEDQYTWWSNRGQAWAKNVGWRIDYQIISADLSSKINTVEIYREQRFSDHAPLIISYN